MAHDFGFEPSLKDYYFVSYCGRYSEALKRTADICSELNKLNVPLWYDRAIPMGTKYATEISKRIEDCRIMMLFISEELLYNPEGEEDSYVLIEFDIARRKRKKIIPIFMSKIDGTKIHSDFDEFYSLAKKRQGIDLLDNYSSKQAAQIIRDSLKRIEEIRMPISINESKRISTKYREITDCDVEIYRNHDYSFSLHSEPSHNAYGLILKILRINLSNHISEMLFEKECWTLPLEVDFLMISPVIEQHNDTLSFQLAYELSAEGIPEASFYAKHLFQIKNPFGNNAYCGITASARTKDQTQSLGDWASTSKY